MPSKPEIRTLLQLYPSTTRDGRQVLKGTLTRDLETINDKGERRHFPTGSEVVLRRTSTSYQLLIIPIDLEERQAEFERARQEVIEHPDRLDIPF